MVSSNLRNSNFVVNVGNDRENNNKINMIVNFENAGANNDREVSSFHQWQTITIYWIIIKAVIVRTKSVWRADKGRRKPISEFHVANGNFLPSYKSWYSSTNQSLFEHARAVNTRPREALHRFLRSQFTTLHEPVQWHAFCQNEYLNTSFGKSSPFFFLSFFFTSLVTFINGIVNI